MLEAPSHFAMVLKFLKNMTVCTTIPQYPQSMYFTLAGIFRICGACYFCLLSLQYCNSYCHHYRRLRLCTTPLILPLCSLRRLATSAISYQPHAQSLSLLDAQLSLRMKRPRSLSMASVYSMLPDQRPRNATASDGSESGLPMLNLKNPIRLSQLEDRLFTLLLDVTKQPGVPPVTLRVAGGWVRDKLLFPSRDLGTDVDIDVALDTMFGNDFAELIRDYLVAHNMEIGSIGVIQKNPDQSKHLETATMRVLGVNIDIVNLRTETYSHDSRIPEVKIGTPSEDAMRRDLTINALFYNINDGSLEDFTQHGFDDIRARVIRTPLPPLTTLLDDPLRALRAVRFAARLNFSMDDELACTCKNSDVHNALAAKVSRERISGELHRILCNKNAPHAIALLVEFGLFPVVMRMPPPSAMLPSHVAPSDVPLHALSALLNLNSLPPLDDSPTPIELVRYAALLSPLAALRCKHAENGKRLKEIAVAQYILRVELRLSSGDTSRVCNLLQAALMFKERIHQGAESLDRLDTAKVLRIAAQDWRSALRIALVMELPTVKPAESFAKVLDGWSGRIDLGEEGMIIVDTYNEYQRNVECLNLDNVWDLRPAINGKELMGILPRLKKGPQMGDIMRQQVDWIVQNPSKGKEDICDWLRTRFQNLT